MRARASGLLAVVVGSAIALFIPLAVASDQGGTYLSWSACPGDPGAVGDVTFDCTPGGGAVYVLVGSFILSSDIPRAHSMTAVVNVAFQGAPTVPRFWQFDPGGCNSSALQLVKSMPSDCDGSINAFCRGDTNQCDLLYVVSPGSNLLRIRITMGLPASNTVPMVQNQRYVAFSVSVPVIGSVNCTGCSTPCTLGFSEGAIYPLDAAGLPLPPIAVSGGFPGAVACATVNGAQSQCSLVPAKRTSWGRLKSLYR